MSLLTDYVKSLSNEPEILIEQWDTQLEPVLTESVENPTELVGVFMQAEKRNRNGRIYPRAVLEEAVDDYMQRHKGKLRIGELDHPQRLEIDPLQAAIHIEELWWEGNNVMGRAKILHGDGGNGDKLVALIKAGLTPGVSSRGGGSVGTGGIVQKGFRLTTPADVVLNPSAIDAFVKAV